MFIPVCHKCRGPLEMVSFAEDGIETLGFRCTECGEISPGFLLSYIEASQEETNLQAIPVHSADLVTRPAQQTGSKVQIP